MCFWWCNQIQIKTYSMDHLVDLLKLAGREEVFTRSFHLPQVSFVEALISHLTIA